MAVAALVGVVAVLAAGCQGPRVDLERELEAARREAAAKDAEVTNARGTIEELRRRVATAQGLDPERLKKVYYPVELRIARLSGGADYDGKPGDDGVTVYLQPVDRDGDVVKAAGEIQVQLYDLTNPSGRQLIGEYRVSVEEAAKLWYGKLMTQHYSIKCPWKAGPPAHNEITIRAAFVDLLTGNVMTAQTTCTVDLPTMSSAGRAAAGSPE